MKVDYKKLKVELTNGRIIEGSICTQISASMPSFLRIDFEDGSDSMGVNIEHIITIEKSYK